MMTSLIVLAVLAPLQQPPRFGKSDAEILRMGRTAWTKFAAEDRMGGSTAGYVASEGVYGEVLRNRNDRLLKAKPALRRSVEGLRESLTNYANEFVAIGSSITGGGTMWNLTAAGIAPDIEETIFTIFDPTVKKPREAIADAQVDAAIAKAERLVRSKRKQIEEGREFSHMSYADCLAALKRARSEKKNALGFAKPLSMATQNATRKYLINAANLDMAG